MKIKVCEKKYTLFEVDEKQYQFCRIPFGVTNGVVPFERATGKHVEDETLKDTFPYLFNVTAAGYIQAEHDKNVQKL